MTKTNVSLKKVIENGIGAKDASKYTDSSDSYSRNAALVYQSALTNLLEGKTEIAIKYIIQGLDLDRNNVQLLDLCKTMLISMSDFLYENKAEDYRKKYSNDLAKAAFSMKKKITELDFSIENAHKNIKKIKEEVDGSKPSFFSSNLYITYAFKKKDLDKKIKGYENDITRFNTEINDIKGDFSVVSRLYKVDEYSRVLGLIIEASAFPSRFESVT